MIGHTPNIFLIKVTNHFIRNQKTWQLSHYYQYIKSGGLLNLNDFIELQLDNTSLDGHYINCPKVIMF